MTIDASRSPLVVECNARCQLRCIKGRIALYGRSLATGLSPRRQTSHHVGPVRYIAMIQGSLPPVILQVAGVMLSTERFDVSSALRIVKYEYRIGIFGVVRSFVQAYVEMCPPCNRQPTLNDGQPLDGAFFVVSHVQIGGRTLATERGNSLHSSRADVNSQRMHRN